MVPIPRKVPASLGWLLLCLSVCCLQGWAACEDVPAGQMLRLRLSQPVSSYSAKPGMTVRGILIESPECNGMPLFPQGTPVEGRVKAVRNVGLGFRHETAALDLEFDLIAPDGDSPIVMHARVMDVDNAREKVKDGVIRGIRGTATAQNRFVLGVGHALSWVPYGFLIPAVSGALFPIVPEPEIYFPAGTDMRLELTAPLAIANSISPALANGEFEESGREVLDSMVSSFTERTSNKEGLAADVVNLLFIGSQEQVEKAFVAAGWMHSDPLSFRSVLSEFHAVFALNNDPRLPMAAHLLDGNPSHSTWQKSLNSYAKRDHLRIWTQPQSWDGQTIWLAASTAEFGASWSFRRRRFIHHVEPEIDEEREKVVRDLSLAGCISAVYNAPRPAMPGIMVGSTGTELRTDGAVAVVQLRDCQPPEVAEQNVATVAIASVARRPRSKFARLVRGQVLSLRNLWRSNAAYDAVYLSRHAVGAIRTSRANHRALAAALQSQSLPADNLLSHKAPPDLAIPIP